MASTVFTVLQAAQQVQSTIEQAANIDRRFYTVYARLATLNSLTESHQHTLKEMEKQGIESSKLVKQAMDSMKTLLVNCRTSADKHLKRNQVSRWINTTQTTFVCTKLEQEIAFQMQTLTLTTSLETHAEQRREAHLQGRHRQEQQDQLSNVRQSQQRVSQAVVESLAADEGLYTPQVLVNTHSNRPPPTDSDPTRAALFATTGRKTTIKRTPATQNSGNVSPGGTPRAPTVDTTTSRATRTQPQITSPLNSPTQPTTTRLNPPPHPPLSHQSNSAPEVTRSQTLRNPQSSTPTRRSPSGSPVPSDEPFSSGTRKPETQRSVTQPLPAVNRDFPPSTSRSETNLNGLTLSPRPAPQPLAEEHEDEEEEIVYATIAPADSIELAEAKKQRGMARYFLTKKNDFEEVSNAFLAAARSFETLGRKEWAGECYHDLAVVTAEREGANSKEDALAWFSKASQLFSESGSLDDQEHARTLQGQYAKCEFACAIILQSSDRNRAIGIFTNIAQVFEGLGDKYQEAACYASCANLLLAENSETAEGYLSTAISIYSDLPNDRHREAQHRLQLAYLQALKPDETHRKLAFESYKSLAKLYEQLEDDENEGLCYMACARLSAGHDDRTEDSYYEWAVDAYGKASKPLSQAEALVHRAKLASSIDDFTARKYYLEAQELYAKTSAWERSADLLVECIKLLGDANGDEDDGNRAEWLVKIVRHYKAAKNQEKLLEYGYHAASLLEDRKDVNGAVEIYQELAMASNDILSKARSNAQCGKLLATSDPSRAATFLKLCASQFLAAGRKEDFAEYQMRAAGLVAKTDKVLAAEMYEDLAPTFDELGASGDQSAMRKHAFCYSSCWTLLAESNPKAAISHLKDAIFVYATFDDESAADLQLSLAQLQENNPTEAIKTYADVADRFADNLCNNKEAARCFTECARLAGNNQDLAATYFGKAGTQYHKADLQLESAGAFVEAAKRSPPSDALPFYDEAASTYGSLREFSRQLECLGAAGDLCEEGSEKALGYYHQAYTAAKNAENYQLEGHYRLLSATTAEHLNKIDYAIGYYSHAAPVFERIEDYGKQLECLIRCGELLREKNRGRAISFFREAYRIAVKRQHNNFHRHARCLIASAELSSSVPEMCADYAKAGEAFRQAKDTEGEVDTLWRRILICKVSDPRITATYYEQAHPMYKTLKIPSRQAACLSGLAHYHQRTSPATAINYFVNAVQAHEEAGEVQLAAECAFEGGKLAASLDRFQQSLELYQNSQLLWARATGSNALEKQADAFEACARVVDEADGEQGTQRAIDFYHKAIDIYRSLDQNDKVEDCLECIDDLRRVKPVQFLSNKPPGPSW